jgi:hypothetical protein
MTALATSIVTSSDVGVVFSGTTAGAEVVAAGAGFEEEFVRLALETIRATAMMPAISRMATAGIQRLALLTGVTV